MGNAIPPCVQNVSTITLDPYQLTWLRSCDAFSVAHFVVPFWLTVWTRSFIQALLLTHLNETVEILLFSLFGSVSLFVSATTETENFAQVLEDILQGFFACLLGKLFLWVYSDAPKLIDYEELVTRPLRFLWYAFWAILAFALGGAFVGAGGQVGRGIYGPIFLISVAPMIWSTSRVKWKDWTEYWIVGLTFTIAVTVQHIWDYFYSSTVQSWIWAGAFTIVLFLLGYEKKVVR